MQKRQQGPGQQFPQDQQQEAFPMPRMYQPEGGYTGEQPANSQLFGAEKQLGQKFNQGFQEPQTNWQQAESTQPEQSAPQQSGMRPGLLRQKKYNEQQQYLNRGMIGGGLNRRGF
jgi:hypothetical protein